MPLFFIISGYLASLNKHSEKSIKKKLIAYGIPYLIFSLVVVVLKMAAHMFVNSALDLKDLIGIIIYPLNSLWFLYALLIIFVVHELVKNQTKGVIGKSIMLTVSLLMMCIAYYVERGTIMNDTWLNDSIIVDVCKYAFWFEIGALLVGTFAKKIEAIRDQRWFVFYAIASLLVYIAAVVALRNIGVSNVFVHTINGIIGSCLIIQLSIVIGKERLIEELGQSTMEIYLLHGYVVSAFRIIITRIGLLDDFGIVPLLACSVTGVVIPMIMYRIVKRIKIVDFCFYPQRYIMYKEKDSIR